MGTPCNDYRSRLSDFWFLYSFRNSSKAQAWNRLTSGGDLTSAGVVNIYSSNPKRGDIIIVKYTPKVHLLKRIIGLPGDTVSFRNGVLYLNGKAKKEPYVKNPCDWNLPERTVEPGDIYVIGDNRSMQMRLHTFGAVSQKRIYGVPLW